MYACITLLYRSVYICISQDDDDVVIDHTDNGDGDEDDDHDGHDDHDDDEHDDDDDQQQT